MTRNETTNVSGTKAILTDQPTSLEEVHLRKPHMLGLQRQYHKHRTTKPHMIKLTLARSLR